MIFFYKYDTSDAVNHFEKKEDMTRSLVSDIKSNNLFKVLNYNVKITIYLIDSGTELIILQSIHLGARLV